MREIRGKHSRQISGIRLKRVSDAGVPGIACFWRCGAHSLTETLQIVGDRQVGKEFHVLVAELARKPQRNRMKITNR
jgi:hypothetical protein